MSATASIAATEDGVWAEASLATTVTNQTGSGQTDWISSPAPDGVGTVPALEHRLAPDASPSAPCADTQPDGLPSRQDARRHEPADEAGRRYMRGRVASALSVAPVHHARCGDCGAINDVPSLPTICYRCGWPVGL
jgi:hypothetical protein